MNTRELIEFVRSGPQRRKETARQRYRELLLASEADGGLELGDVHDLIESGNELGFTDGQIAQHISTLAQNHYAQNLPTAATLATHQAERAELLRQREAIDAKSVMRRSRDREFVRPDHAVVYSPTMDLDAEIAALAPKFQANNLALDLAVQAHRAVSICGDVLKEVANA